MLKMFAHRGDTIRYPQNTLDAFESAFKYGAQGVEMDIHLFHNDIIVIHDYLFDRRGVYPRLDDILEKIHNQGRIEIEIKAWDTKILKPLRKIISRYPKADFELTTSEIPLAHYIKETFSNILTGLIMHAFLFEDWMTFEVAAGKITGWGSLSQANVVHLSYSTIEQFGKGRLVKYIHQKGLKVHSHISRDSLQEERVSNLKKWGIDQCTIDDVSLCKLQLEKVQNMPS